jgi:large conductance mechanosensitive channel
LPTGTAGAIIPGRHRPARDVREHRQVREGEELVMLEEFRKFAMRGNVLDMAVGVIIGGAFGRITTSLVNDVLMPPVGLLLGNVDFTDLYVTLSGATAPTLAAAQEAGAVTLNYGVFLNTVINFLIVAFAVFLLVRTVNRLKERGEAPPPPATTKTCPLCRSTIHLEATRCPQCTSELAAA